MKIKLIALLFIGSVLFGGCEKNDDSLKYGMVYIPTAFSPDNNKINDVFKPVGENLSKVVIYKMIITDENGNKLFTSEKVADGWNGLKSNGDPYPNGFYFYDIWFHFSNNTEERVVGTVELTVGGW